MRGWFARIVTVALRGGVAAFALALCIHGSTKKPAKSAAPVRAAAQSDAQAFAQTAAQADVAEEITDEDIARGWRLVSVSTNAAVSYAMPTNGATCGKWHLRGAYEDLEIVDFGDWKFPVGTGETSKVWTFVWGRLRPALRDAAHEIRAVDAPMSAIPSVSRLWTAATEEGGRLVTWARSECSEANWLPNSTLNWKIPIGWHRKLRNYDDWHSVGSADYEVRFKENTRPLLIGGRMDLYKLKRHIDSDGVYRTEKFGHWISRDRWCKIILDGTILQRVHPLW